MSFLRYGNSVYKVHSCARVTFATNDDRSMKTWIIGIVVATSLLLFVEARNVALYKSYTLSEPGATRIRYSSHGEGDYTYISTYDSSCDRCLTSTLDDPLSTFPHGLLWHHTEVDFNVSIVMDMETPTQASTWRISGACCHQGIFTPIAGYVHGSDLTDGPWTIVGAKVDLTAGDQMDAPAETYQLDIAPVSNDSYRFFRITVTGEANRYVSIYSLQLLVADD